MTFSFSAQQLRLRDAVRELLDKQCTSSDVRAGAGSRARWLAVSEMGVIGMLAPQDHGGLGMNEIDLALVLEEAGRAALPEPLVETACIGVPLLAALKPDALAPIMSGERTLGVGDLSGPFVPADRIVLRAGDELHLLNADDVMAMPYPSLDPTRPLVTVKFETTPATRIAAGNDALIQGRLVWLRGVFGTSAVLLGVAQKAIELAVAYAKDRHQFGKPIGSFQAVKHRLADAHVRLELARPVVYRAAHTLALGPDTDRARDVAMAKAVASDAATNACKAALQVHGAIGYTEEHDLHLWLRRGFALANAWGTAAEHRDRVASFVFGS